MPPVFPRHPTLKGVGKSPSSLLRQQFGQPPEPPAPLSAGVGAPFHPLLSLRKFDLPRGFIPASSINAYPVIADAVVGSDSLRVDQLNPGFIPFSVAIQLNPSTAVPKVSYILPSSINANPVITDSVHGSDALTLSAVVPSSDSAHGTDAIQEADRLAVGDSASGADAGSIKAVVQATGAGAGVDSIVVQQSGDTSVNAVDAVRGVDALVADGPRADEASTFGDGGGGITTHISMQSQLPTYRGALNTAVGRDRATITVLAEFRESVKGRASATVNRYDPLDDEEMFMMMLLAEAA